jgi:hypothetical protein
MRHMAIMGSMNVHIGIWCGNLNEGDHLGDLVADGRMILKCIPKKLDARKGTRLIWLRKGTSGGIL